MREGKGAMLVKTYEVPSGVGTRSFAKMAVAHGLHVAELSETAITLEGREDDHAVFADWLAQLRRLWRAQRDTLTEGCPPGPRQDAVGKAAGALGAAPATRQRPGSKSHQRAAYAALRGAWARFLSTP
jgi:hypothetical protein